MGLILGWIFSIIGWVFAGILTWNWIEPDNFATALLWLIIFSVIAAVFRSIFGIIGALIGSLFD